jgi:hypothetical protein
MCKWRSGYVTRNDKNISGTWRSETVANRRNFKLDVSDNHLVFTQDEEFSSPSAAAAVVHGGHANGLTAWKNKEGKTLTEIEST